MKWIFGFSGLGLALFTVAALSFTGCGTNHTAMEHNDAHAEEGHDHGDEHGHVHGEWWCGEHGVPEEVCALCNSKLIPGFKEKGDWCEDHNRPASQCFICSPELFDKFAARYKAKEGKAPPMPEDLKKDSDS